jgi:hypothetical protein
MSLTRIATLIAAVLLLSLDTPAQRKAAHRKSTRPAQSRVQPQPSPQPQPTPDPPKKTDDELLVEHERQILSTLSTSDKAAVRDALESMNRTLRRLQVGGYNKYLLEQDETKQTEALVNRAVEVLPASVFKNLIAYSWRAMLESHTADFYYREGLLESPSGADKFIEIVDRYKLKGVPSALVGERILGMADKGLELANMLAQQADIMPTSQH